MTVKAHADRRCIYSATSGDDRQGTLATQKGLAEYARTKGITDHSKVGLYAVSALAAGRVSLTRDLREDPEPPNEDGSVGLNLMKIYNEAKRAVDAELENGPPLNVE